MDELIRELEEQAAEAERYRNQLPITSTQTIWFDGLAQAYRQAARMATEAKRRMAEQTPAWDLGEPAWDPQ